jgi:hypothetical protein
MVGDWDNVLKWSYSLAQYVIESWYLGVTSARKFVLTNAVKAIASRISRIPDEYFIRKRTWKGWRDFLGYPEREIRHYLGYKVPRLAVEWCKIRKIICWKGKPSNLPAVPVFLREWNSWKDFLGSSYQQPDPRHYTKLKVADVRIIKHQLNMGVPGAVLARTFKVSEMQISRIKRGENWEDI